MKLIVDYKPPTVQPIDKIILEMSEEEAKILMALVGLVGGDPKSKVRLFTDKIWNDLKVVLGRIQTSDYFDDGWVIVREKF